VFSAFLLLVLILKVLSAKCLAPEQLSSSITFLFLVIIMVPTNCKMYAIARRAAKRNKQRAEKQKQQSTTVTFQDSHKIQGECDNLHDAESTNLHEESNSLHEESNNLHEESNKSNEESNNLHEDSNKSHEESNNLHEESNKSHEESNKSHEDSNKSHEESNKSHEECNKSHEESNNLQNDNVQDKQRNKLSPKNISTCILAVACFILCALPGMIFNGIIFSQGKSTFDKDHYKVFLLWIRTLITMNSSFNTLVFFWKNSTLRKEGKQVLKKMR
jgi:ABC-type nickel/cobalt efflux system permease component RcnA